MKNLISSVALAMMLMFSFNSQAQEWTVLNPYPTFNSLLAVSFPSADTGYIAGNNSAVFRTFDGGETWKTLEIPVGGVQISSMKFETNTQGTIVSWSYIFSTTDAGETWNYQNIQINGDISDSFFLNDTLGWLAGSYELVAKTIDGGQNWDILSNKTNGSIMFDAIEFANADTGYVVGNTWWSETNPPVMRRSDNGGSNWYDIELPEEIWSVYDLDVLGPLDVWIASGQAAMNSDSTGYVDKAYHTIDGGLSWTKHEAGIPYGHGIEKIKFFNSLEGRLLSDDYIYSTSDGGNYWSKYFIESPGYMNCTDFSWPDPNHCVAVGWSPNITISNDGGQTWDEKIRGTTGFLKNICFINENKGFITGNENNEIAMWATNDGGDTWIEADLDSVPYGTTLYSIAFSNETSGWAVYYGKVLYQTIDGGLHWQLRSTGFDYSLKYISLPDDTHIFMSSDWIDIVKSTDGGNTWTDISPNLPYHREITGGLVFTDALTGYVGLFDSYQTGKLLKTINGGNSWSEINYGFSDKIISMTFSDNLNGIISLENTGLLITGDGGLTWSNPLIIAPHDIKYVKLFDSTHGIATYRDEFVAYTADGGQSWLTTYEGVSCGGSIQSTYFLNENIGWICGYEGLTMRYNETYIGIEPAIASKPADNFFYPNPADDVIQLQKDNYLSIQIFSIEGSLVQTYLPPFGESINITALKSGMYIVEIHTAQGIKRQKLLKR